MATTYRPGDTAPESGVYPVLHATGEPVDDWREATKGEPLPDDIGAFVYGAPLDGDEAEAARLMLATRGQPEAPVSFGHALALTRVAKQHEEAENA